MDELTSYRPKPVVFTPKPVPVTVRSVPPKLPSELGEIETNYGVKVKLDNLLCPVGYPSAQ